MLSVAHRKLWAGGLAGWAAGGRRLGASSGERARNRRCQRLSGSPRPRVARSLALTAPLGSSRASANPAAPSAISQTDRRHLKSLTQHKTKAEKGFLHLSLLSEIGR